jgi:hypothetical protein
MRITVEQLCEANACSEQVEVFAKEWPDGIEVTQDSVDRAVELDLDIGWLAVTILPTGIWTLYQARSMPHWREYTRKLESIYNAHGDVRETDVRIVELNITYRKAIAAAFLETVQESGL